MTSRLWTVNHVKYGAWYEHDIKHLVLFINIPICRSSFLLLLFQGSQSDSHSNQECFASQSEYNVCFSLSHCTDCPPVLFKVSCAENSVQIGGNPWHYIYTPPRKKDEGTYHICSLKDGTMVYLKFLNYKFTSLLPFSYGCTLSKTWQ